MINLYSKYKYKYNDIFLQLKRLKKINIKIKNVSHPILQHQTELVLESLPSLSCSAARMKLMMVIYFRCRCASYSRHC